MRDDCAARAGGKSPVVVFSPQFHEEDDISIDVLGASCIARGKAADAG